MTSLISFITPSTSHGFTTTVTMSEPCAATAFSVVTLVPFFAKCSRRFSLGSATVMSPAWNVSPFSRPSTSEPPIAPAPITVIFIFYYLLMF